MRQHKVRQVWQAGGAALNGWCAIPSSFASEIMAHMGWDSLVIDTQHGIVDYQVMVTMLQAISTTDVTPMVRVPWNDPAAIMKALDAGSFGIICPMVNGRKECENFVRACRYAPRGYRSSGPTRAMLYGGPDYQAKANDTMLALAMIETREALDNLDAILSTPELDGIYIGPSDLSISLGFAPGLDRTEDAMLKTIGTILEACKRHKVRAGIHTGATAYAKRMIALGFDLVTVLSDTRLLSAAGAQAMQELRGPAPARAAGAAPY